jgi:hypothetical protein
MQAALWAGCGLCVLATFFSAYAERRRLRRTDIDAIGWVPWIYVMITAIIAAAVFASVAIKAV